MARLKRFALAAVLAVSAFAAQAQDGVAMAASHAATPAAVTTSVTPDTGGTWVPYDGSKITTQSKCEARAAYLRKVYPNDQFTCFSHSNPCGPGYWIVYILQHGAAAQAAREPSARVAA